MSIHETAIIGDGAIIHPTAQVGPLCVIGPNVEIGEETKLISHVSVQGHTTIGSHNTIHPFAVLGGTPQDLKYDGESSKLVIGRLREYHRQGTLAEKERTSIVDMCGS